MTKSFSLIFFIFLTVIACNKEEFTPDSKDHLSKKNEMHEIDIFSKKMSSAQISYMESMPDYDEAELKKAVEIIERELPKGSARMPKVWGIGADHRVYKWNGSSWYEPNSAARLEWVEVSTYDGNAVWGIGTDQRVYRWNGSSWYEPNSAAGLYYISAFSGSMAVGIGHGGYLYITTNGGANWQRFTSITGVRWISVGSVTDNFLWGVNLGWGLMHYNYSTASWETKRLPYLIRRTSAMFGSGVWTVNESFKIHRSADGVSFQEPNPAAGLYMISGRTFSSAWGVGGGNRVFKTSNSGANWQEPNSAARLIHVSSN